MKYALRCAHCGIEALFMRHPPTSKARIILDQMFWKDGRPLKDVPPVCPECKQVLIPAVSLVTLASDARSEERPQSSTSSLQRVLSTILPSDSAGPDLPTTGPGA